MKDINNEVMDQNEGTTDVVVVDNRNIIQRHPVVTGIVIGAALVGTGILVHNLLSDDDDVDDEDCIDVQTQTF